MITRTDLLDKLQNGAVWNTGVTFERTNPVPIEKYSIFETLAKAQEYAFENPVAYPGQTLAVVTDTNEVTLYIVQANAASAEQSLVEVGSATLGDGVSVELDETTKVIKLKDFGKFYYREIVNTETNEEGKVNTTITYEKVTGFKSGLQPRVRVTEQGELELAWYEPSSLTVEGLSDRITSLTETVGTIEDVATTAKETADQNAIDIDELQGTVSNHGTRLESAEADITDIKSTRYTKDEVNQLISEQSHFTTKIVETSAEVTTAGVLYLIKDPTAAGQDTYLEYIYVEGEGAVCIGDTTTNLSDYYNKKAVDDKLAEKANAADVTDDIDGITERLNGIDGKFADYATNDKLAEELAKYDTSEQVDAKVKVATDAAQKNAEDISDLNDTIIEQGDDIREHAQGLIDVNLRVDNTNEAVAGVNKRIDELGNTYATDEELAAVKKELQDAQTEALDDVNAELANKANAADVYDKNAVDTKFSSYSTTEQVDQKIAAIFGESDNLADYITDNRNSIGGLLSTADKELLDSIEDRLDALAINSTEEIVATTNTTSGGVDLTIGKVAVSKLESDVTLFLNCGDAETV